MDDGIWKAQNSQWNFSHRSTVLQRTYDIDYIIVLYLLYFLLKCFTKSQIC